MGTILSFSEERPAFLRDQANKMYSVGPYYMTKVFIEMPVYVIIPMVNLLIVYFGIGVRYQVRGFFYFYLSQFLIGMCASSYGYLIASIFSNGSIAVELAPIIMQPIIIFAGFLVNV